jgi:hypothetical protein
MLLDVLYGGPYHRPPPSAPALPFVVTCFIAVFVVVSAIPANYCCGFTFKNV